MASIPPKFQAFADALAAAMKAKNISASDLAREVWGSVTDSRNYSVAKNRDRVGHYLSGGSYPTEGNLEAIARALDVPVETLRVEKPAGNPGPRSRAAGTGATLSPIPSQPSHTRLQVDQVVPWELAAEIFQRLKQSENQMAAAQLSRQSQPLLPGTVIEGGNGNGDNGDDDDTRAA